MQRLTAAHTGTTSSTDEEGLFTADKQVQTDFPAGMLEDYVVKNRKRILKLLGLSGNASSGQSKHRKPFEMHKKSCCNSS